MTMVEMEVVDLKARVEWLETQVRRLTGDYPNNTEATTSEPLSDEQLMAWLRAKGLLVEPTAEDKRLAAEWEALPEEEKKAIRWELDHLPPGPMVSDIVIGNRR